MIPIVIFYSASNLRAERVFLLYTRLRSAIAGNICFALVVPLGCFSIGFPQAGPRAVTSARLCQLSPLDPILRRAFRAKLITLPASPDCLALPLLLAAGWPVGIPPMLLLSRFQLLPASRGPYVHSFCLYVSLPFTHILDKGAVRLANFHHSFAGKKRSVVCCQQCNDACSTAHTEVTFKPSSCGESV